MDAVNAVFDELSGSVGFPPDQLKFLFCLFASYPLGFLLKHLPNSPALKHVYSIVFSALFSWLCVGPYAILHTIFSSLVAYLMMAALPHGVAHKLVFVWALGYMSASHIYRMATDWMGWTMDFTTAQMLITQKMISMAFNYYDGNKPADKVTKEQFDRAIKKLPGLLEYFGFIFFLPSYLAGPSLEITEYQRYISGEMFNDPHCKGKAPGSLLPALGAIGKALLLAPLLIVQPNFPVRFLLTEEYNQMSWLVKLVRLWLHCSLCRMKYYFAWFLSEGVFIATGIGYRLDGDTVRWDRFRNMEFFGVEVAPNVRSVTTYWNMRTADWLRHYVYTRVVPESHKGPAPMYATVATYSVSAFWHGFYPGYYMFFLLTAVVTEVAKDVRRNIRPLFVDDKKPNRFAQFVYDVLTTVATSLFLNYGGSQFLLLDFHDGLTLVSHVHYFGHIIAIGALVFFRSPLARLVFRRPKSAKKAE